MATITDRARGRTSPRQGRHLVVSAARVQLGTRTEAMSAQNFGLTTLYQVHSTGVALGGSTGTILNTAVRNPGSVNARASVTAIRLVSSAGTVVWRRIIAGTVSGEFTAIGN